MKTTKYILTIALALVCAWSNSFAITSSYYSSIDGTKESGLRNALYTITSVGPANGHNYDNLWNAYKTTDVYPAGHAKAGKIWDMYSDCTFTPGSNQCGNYNSVCDCYNREHSLPKSWFNDKTPAYYDMGHIVPTDGKVNGMRSNYGFGEVNGGTTWGTGKLGNAKAVTTTNVKGSSTITTSYKSTVFEPADEYKGDFARMYMYMIVRYKYGNSNSISFTSTSDGQLMFNNTDDNYGLTDYSIALLMKWHRQDPVSEKEINRNNGMETVQGNRNPFIDYPCLAEYLWGNKAGETVTLSQLVGTFSGSWTTGDGCPCGDVPTITLPAGDVFVGSTEAGTPVSKTIMVQGVNLTSGLSFAISGTNSSLFSLSANTMTQANATSGSSLTITYSPSSAGDHTATLTISGGGLASNYTIELSGTCCSPYIITLSRNGITETIGACGTYTLPTAEDEGEACDGWEFAGWITDGTSFTENQTTKPSFVEEVNSATTVYAIYSKTTDGSSAPKRAKMEDTWSKVTDASTLKSGDILVIASCDNGATAGNISSQIMASVSSTFSSDKSTITSLGSGTIELTLGGTSGAWTLSSSSGALGATAAKKLAWGSGTTTWSISISSGNATITNGTSSYGSMQYNTQSPRFTTYTSGQAAVQLYRKSGGSSSPTNYKKLPCTTYLISYADEDGIAAGGNYSANVTSALAGTTITLDYDEAEHYEFTGWTVTNTSTSGTIAVTNNQFTMPEADVTVQANFTATCTGTLATPSVTATPGDGQITLTWEDVEGANSYTISIGTGVGYTTECSSPSIGDITHAGTTNTCVISGLVNGLSYTASVLAHSATVCEGEAGDATATPGEVVCSNKVNISKDTPSNGSFNLDKTGEQENCSVGGLVVQVTDIEPAEGYEFGAITQTGIASGVTIDQNAKTVTYAKDVTGSSTINVVFESLPTYEIKFYNMGVQVGETQNLYIGQTAVKPADPTACTGYTFVGWWTETLAEDNTTAETWVTDFTVSEAGNKNYYAVYSHVDGEGGGGSSTPATLEASFSSHEGWTISGTGGSSYWILKEGASITSPVIPDLSTVTSITFKARTYGGSDYKTINVTTSGSEEVGSATASSTSLVNKTISVSGLTGSGSIVFISTTTSSANGPGINDIVINYSTGSSTTYYTTEPDCVECLNKVTIEKGEENNGTFSLDKDGTYDNCKVGGLVVHVTDIAPSEDYQFKEITQEGIDAGVTIDQENKTVTYDKDVAGSSIINVVFEHKPTYTIRFYNGESLIGSAQTVTKDKSPSVPADPTACDGYTFVGWWTSALPASNTESHTWVSDFTVTDNQDYYAVYRHNEGGSGSGTVSFVSSEQYTNGAVATAKTIDGVTFTFAKGGNSSNAPMYYSSGTSVRMYADNTLTISAESSITAIAFTFGGTTSAGLDADEGTYSAGAWSGEATSITFTAGSTGQQHIQSISVTVDGGGTNYYTSVFSCSGHTITVAEVEHGSGVSDKSRCDEGGTVTITLTADEGYECGGITTSPSVATAEASECTYTFTMPNEDITVTPVFTPKTPRTFTFEEGTGHCDTETLTEAVWYGGVTLPTATANSGCDPEYVFSGWAKEAVTTETEVRPTLYAAGTLYNEEETTLYAVYSQTTGGSASGFTLSCTIGGVTYYATARTGTNTYMGASNNEAEAARFSIVTSNDKKYLCWHGETDMYVYNNSNDAKLIFTSDLSNALEWDVTETETTLILEAANGRRFLINNSLKDRFAAYSRDEYLTKGDAGTTVYNTNPSCVCYSVDITYNANGGILAEGCENIVGGDCERDWLLCDAPTREGYLFTNWKDQNGTLYNAGATVSELKLSLTLTAQWIPAPYTVLFDAGSGSCVESLTEPSRGDGIILPKAEPSAACAEDWTFVGWSATALEGETNTTASIIGVAGTPYTPASNNVTLYAIYSSLDEGGATTDYTRVTASTPEEGDYVIVVAKSDASFGLVTYGTASGGRLAYTEAYTSLPTTTISTPTATQIWHLTYNPEGYAYLYNANAGAYLAASGTNITFNANAGSAFVLTKNAGTYGDYECLNNTASESKDYYLGVNKDYDFIRYYASQTLNAVNSVSLYKGSTGTRYYATSPECTPCTDPEWSFELGTSVVKTKGSEPFTNNVIKGHESGGTVTYSSTNEAVATVDASGLVTLVGTGNTTITLRLTKEMPYCAAVLQYELEVKEPSIDIVGVTPDGEIVIEHDLEGTITLDLSEGHAISTGTAANDLFFSKYFEAASNMKLFAIFNGTGHDMDISNIRVRCNCTTDEKWPKKTGDFGYVELRTISKLREMYPKLKIPSGTELIFWSNNKGNTSGTIARNTELRECITFTIGDMEYKYSDMEAMEIPNWFCLGDYTTYQTTDADGNNQFVFNGDDSMILERYNPATGQWEAIDLFGAGTSAEPASKEGLVENIDTEYVINGVSQKLNDGNGFHAECEGKEIPLSTNRYMLVRMNSVVDGMHAVASNATSFATLCEEWDGTPVGGSSEGYCRSGEVFSEIAEYDYAQNYIDWETITKDDYDVEEKENGTTTITFDEPLDLDARACSLLKIEVRDKDDASKILATTEYKIPIVVKAGEVMTSADLFHDQGDKCATCDVAILGSATLTKATDGATNDMPEVRDIYVYGGGQLVIPEGTHYKAHDLIMRMEMADDKVNVAVPNIQATGSLTNQYGGAIRQQVRVGTNRFYQFAVPYPVRLEDVTFSDGRPAIYGEDFMIRYYDGESRAQNLGTASNWKNFEGTELQPGIGYTLAVAKKAGHEQRELIFPMADASLAEGEPATKTTAIHAWGDNTIRANHRGWNFLSNPYLTTYGENHLDDNAGGMLTTGRLVDDPEHTGWWVNDEGTVPYVTIINGTRTDYTQERVALQDLPPFTTFFIQAGDDDHHSGEEFSLTFNRDHRKASAPAYIRAKQKAPVARFGVLLNGNNATDNCGMVIGEDYSAAYDMQADLSKEFGSAYSLKLYTLQEDQMRMAFLATHPDSLRKPVPVGVRMPANAEYTFSLDRRYNLGAFDHIYLTDNVTGQHTDLLDDNYSFTGTRSQNDARFSLFVEMKKDTPTNVENLLNGIYVTGRKGALILTGLPETADIYIYDISGRLVQTKHTHGETSVTLMTSTGVYQIRIQSEGAKALLRTIVH